jgi:cytochrome c peroxidase
MNFRVPSRTFLVAALFVIVFTAVSIPSDAGSKTSNPLVTPDSSGSLSTFDKNGGIDVSNPFFQNLGSNGRTCNTCHVSSQAWSVTPESIQARFNGSNGTDPIFRPVDGAVCPSADVSTKAARSSAYRQLLSKGLIRVSLSVPANAEFTIVDVSDPYNCPETTATNPAFFRRPLPSTNLGFLSAVMWDGRESGSGKSLEDSLASQAIDATTGHAEAKTAPTADQVRKIVAFEKALFTAQSNDEFAGSLSARTAKGGPMSLSAQDFFIGINDPLGGNPTGKNFDPVAFTTFAAWGDLTGSDNANRARRSIARGQALFNSLPIAITNVRGLNDSLNVEVIQGTCTTCHDSPNVGNHSMPLALDIGVVDPAPPVLDVAGLPVYTVICNATSQMYRVTDLGRAMITGKCVDIGKTKGPILRALSARAPYFHNGSAATLNDVVEFYDQRFTLNLSQQQKSDLVAFLKSL